MDETFVGGKVKNMHRPRSDQTFTASSTQGGNGKAVVMGMLERGGQVSAQVVDRTHQGSTLPMIDVRQRGRWLSRHHG